MANHMGTVEKSAGFSMLPPEFEPISSWGYVGYTILFSFPVVGLIFLIVFAFSGKNINRRNFARSYFCVAIIVIAIYAILAVTGYLSVGRDAIDSAVSSATTAAGSLASTFIR
jgi:hypothetical protein